MKKLAWLGFDLLTAYLGFILARGIDSGADVRGGFLLLSPILVISAVTAMWPWEPPGGDTRSAPHELRHRVEGMARRFGADVPEIEADESATPFSLDGLTVRKGKLLFFLANWKRLSADEQEFLLASQMAEFLFEKRRPFQDLKWRSTTLTLGAAGSLIACLNLWLILPLQFAGLTGSMAWAAWYGRRRTLQTDLEAIRATGNLEGAIRYIAGHSHHAGFVSSARRIDNLRRSSASI